ncbi:hypothetical protein MMC34_005664 [Xylographa carneopallida]|nr:hypothetical protein [Xylographa carneopallida]
MQVLVKEALLQARHVAIDAIGMNGAIAMAIYPHTQILHDPFHKPSHQGNRPRFCGAIYENHPKRHILKPAIHKLIIRPPSTATPLLVKHAIPLPAHDLLARTRKPSRRYKQPVPEPNPVEAPCLDTFQEISPKNDDGIGRQEYVRTM